MYKKSFLLYLFLLFYFIGWGQNHSFFTESGLSPNNYFLIPENVEDGDIVGRFYSWFHQDTANAICFFIDKNVNGIYSIDKNTGTISIAKAENMPGIVAKDTVHQLIIETIDGEQSDIDTAFIRIKESSFCQFIDPAFGTDGNGSRTLPFDSWDDVHPIKGGLAYFQKRGTTNNDSQITVTHQGQGTDDSPTCFGAYGVGKRPIFDGTAYQYNYVKGILIGKKTPEVDSVSYVQIYEYIFYNWGGNGIYSGTSNFFIEVNNCEFNRNGQYKYGPGIYFLGDSYARTPQYCCIRNCISHNNTEHGIKFENCYNSSITNVWCYNNIGSTGHGIQLVGGQYNSVYGALLINNQNMGIRSRDSHDVYEFLNIDCYPAGDHGIEIDTVVDYPYARYKYGDYNTIRNFIITGAKTGYETSAGIKLLNTSTYNNIQDGEIFGNDFGILLTGRADNTSISRVHIHDNLSSAIFLTNSPNYSGGHSLLSIDYCLINSNKEAFGYNSSKANGLKIDNCTVYNNDIDISVNSQVQIRNTIFEVISGTFSGSTNYGLEEASNPFVDADAGDFTLTNKTSAYNIGQDLGYQYDIRKYKLGNTISVGAYDYFAADINSSYLTKVEELVELYPVPVVEDLTITNLPEQCQISVYSLMGNMLLNWSLKDCETKEINFGKFKQGIYIVKINSPKIGQKTFRILKL